MKNQKRNTRQFYYANYVSTTPTVTDDDPPVETGEYEVTYTTPARAEGSFSSVRGEAMARIFGIAEDYDAVLTLFGNTIGLTKASVLWVDETNVSNPYDYIVKKVAPNLNVTLVAIKKVQVNA